MEYALVFASIVLGVGVAFELENLNRILRSKKVTWHWAQPAFALLVLLTVVAYWWGAAGNAEGSITFAQFLPIMFQLVMLVLMCAVSLPDSIPEEGIDLATYYQDNARYQWILANLFFWSVHFGYVWRVITSFSTVESVIYAIAPDTVFGLLFLAMIFVRKWRYVAIGFAIFSLAPLVWAARTLG